MRSESREQVYLYYAEPQGGNEDLFLVILNYEFLKQPLLGKLIHRAFKVRDGLRH